MDIHNRGTNILTAKPFAYTLSSKHRTNLCDQCLKGEGKLQKCSGCQYVYYCNKICQKESWSTHKFECKNLKKVWPRVVPDAARLMARIIIKLSMGGNEEKGYYSKSEYRKFKDLMSHYSDLKNDTKRMEHFTSLCGVLFEFLDGIQMPNSAELLGIYGRICVNSFNILDTDMNSIGVGIYLGPSVIDHSCTPNAVAVFEGTRLFIRALEDLPYLDFSKIKISYIDVLNVTENRQSELQSTHYFTCTCEKCKESDPLATAGACPVCSGPLNIDEKACRECQNEPSAEWQKSLAEVIEFSTYHLERMKNMAYLDVSKLCLEKQKGLLHPLNIQRVRTIESAFDSAVNVGSWNDAEKYGKQLLPGYIHYYREIHPLTGLLYLMIGKIQLMHMNDLEQAVEFLTKAKEILSITHGEKHSLFRDSVQPLVCQALAELKISRLM